MFKNSEHFPRYMCSDSLLTRDVNADFSTSYISGHLEFIYCVGF